MTDHSLENVVARARRGDQDAMGVLAQRAAGVGLRTAMVALADQHLARDVSQEVAIRVLRNLGALRSADRFDAWAYQITVAETRRAMRRQTRRREVYIDAPLDAMAAEDPTAHLIVGGELQAALAELSPRERVALALRYVHDLDDEEIGRAMRCRPGTVRSLISRARAKLRGNPRLSPFAAAPPSLAASNLETP